MRLYRVLSYIVIHTISCITIYSNRAETNREVSCETISCITIYSNTYYIVCYHI